MSSDTIITVEGLASCLEGHTARRGKRYSLRHQTGERYTALRDVVAEAASRPFRALGSKVGKWKGKNGSSPSDSPTDGFAAANIPTFAPFQSSIFQLPTSASTEEFWALRDINFEVRQGEVLGIIGRNGAGKSTLLEILSRITDPTEVRIKIKGRVASPLEIGTGENIF